MLSVSTLFVGPMKSGKSQRLLSHAHSLNINEIPWKAYKPAIDTRDGAFIKSRHPLEQVPAKAISYASDILEDLKEDDSHTRVVLVDEVMFLDSGIISVVSELKRRQISIAMSGLDYDCRKMWFPFSDQTHTMEQLSAISDIVVGCKARCDVCNEWEAIWTQMVIDGSPVVPTGLLIEVGDALYEARCDKCFVGGINGHT